MNNDSGKMVNEAMRHFTCLLRAIGSSDNQRVHKEIDYIKRILDNVGKRYSRK